jgi:hypothetical protein
VTNNMPNQHFRRCDGHHEMVDSGPGNLGGDGGLFFCCLRDYSAPFSNETLAASPSASTVHRVLSSGAHRQRVHSQQYKGHDEHAACSGADSGFHSPVHAVVVAAGRRGGCCIGFRGHWLYLLDWSSYAHRVHGIMRFGGCETPTTQLNTKV